MVVELSFKTHLYSLYPPSFHLTSNLLHHRFALDDHYCLHSYWNSCPKLQLQLSWFNRFQINWVVGLWWLHNVWSNSTSLFLSLFLMLFVQCIIRLFYKVYFLPWHISAKLQMVLFKGKKLKSAKRKILPQNGQLYLVF